MYGLNAVALVFFGCINVLAYQLCKCPEWPQRKVVTVLCAILLSGNLLRYCVVYPYMLGTPMIPVEFSTVSYFAVPIILLASRTRLYSWAAYSGLMAGFFYYMAMIAAGGPLYNAEAPLDVYISMLCHGTIYFCGFVLLAAEHFSCRERGKLLLGVGLIAARAALLRPLAARQGRQLIYILLDAAAVRQLVPQSARTFALPVYYLAVTAFVLLTVRAFFRRNQKQYRRFSALRAA